MNQFNQKSSPSCTFWQCSLPATKSVNNTYYCQEHFRSLDFKEIRAQAKVARDIAMKRIKELLPGVNVS